MAARFEARLRGGACVSEQRDLRSRNQHDRELTGNGVFWGHFRHAPTEENWRPTERAFLYDQ
jgi:hypothetical protein